MKCERALWLVGLSIFIAATSVRADIGEGMPTFSVAPATVASPGTKTCDATASNGGALPAIPNTTTVDGKKGLNLTNVLVTFTPGLNAAINYTCTLNFTMQVPLNIIVNDERVGIIPYANAIITSPLLIGQSAQITITASTSGLTSPQGNQANPKPVDGKFVRAGPKNPNTTLQIVKNNGSRSAVPTAVNTGGTLQAVGQLELVALGAANPAPITVNFPGSFDLEVCDETNMDCDVSSTSTSDGDAPLPIWSLVLLGGVLILLVARSRRDASKLL